MANLKLKRAKCNFYKCEIHCLGHSISGQGICPLSGKLQSINNLPVPRMPNEVRQMLGLMGSSYNCIPIYANLVQTSTQLTHKMFPFMWTDQYKKAFNVIKKLLKGVQY